jgi:bifunctional non-homologous end joining protein LigD
LLAASKEQQLEGIVAKRLDSPYVPGSRRGEWLKIKNLSSQELVIGGWLAGQKGRASRLGALLIGYYDTDEHDSPVLRYAGRVGTGFTDRELERLGKELHARGRKTSPFVGTQPPREARFVEPELVAEIEFREWTNAGSLRHPSYKGLREDKNAKEVVRERPA